MEFIKSISSPLRKHNLYSSQKHLMDAEAPPGIEISENTDDSENEKANIIKHEKQQHSCNFKDTDNSSEGSSSCSKPFKKANSNTSIDSLLDVLDEENNPLDIKSSTVFNSQTVMSHLDEIESISESLNEPSQRDKNEYNSNNASEKKSGSKKELPLKTNMEEIELKPLKKEKKNNKPKFTIIGVHITKTEILKNHPFLIYPIVKIYIVNLENEECLNLGKSSNENFVCTKPFDFVKFRTIVPEWNELILFEEKIIEEANKVPSILILFEITDLLDKKTSKDDLGKHQTIAWAFLKPFESNRKNLFNRKIKLQLYEIFDGKNNTFLPKSYESWKENQWKIYPSILFITLKAAQMNKNRDYILNMKISIFNSQQNKELEILKGKSKPNSLIKAETFTKYNERKNGEECKIPNRIIKCLNSRKKGAFIIKFSNCGEYLAYSTSDDEHFIIFVYKVPQFVQEAQLIHHKNFVYDLCWSFSSNVLLTASADLTVCIWDLNVKKGNLLQQLVHPAFVYSSQFCPISDTIVTGCYDKIIRIWLKVDNEYDVNQELLGHEGFINSICFVNKSNVFYSGDSTGLIIKWNYNKRNWFKILAIKVSEIRNHVINDLVMFPDNQRMLVVLRDTISWVLDLATSTSLLCLKDGFEFIYQLRGSVSSCGSSIFIGNCVWSALTGKLMAIYNPNLFDHHTITAFHIHPYYNIIAMGCGFIQSPIIACDFIDNYTDTNLNMEIFTLLSFNEKKRNIVPSKANKEIYFDNNQLGDKHKLDDNILNQKRLKFKKRFSSSANFNKGLIERLHGSKLWNLINRMDDVLLIARKGREYAEKKSNALKVINNENQISDGYKKKRVDKSGSSSDPTISVDLSHFNKIFQLRADVHKSQNEKSKSECTHTIDRNDGERVKDDSSTLSAAESLEDDLQTYTISNVKNVPKDNEP